MASISLAEITTEELQPRAHDRTGWRDLAIHAMDTFEERRRTQIEVGWLAGCLTTQIEEARDWFVGWLLNVPATG